MGSMILAGCMEMSVWSSLGFFRACRKQCAVDCCLWPVARVKVLCKVSIELGEERLNGTTLDLSLNGMLVQAGRALPFGSQVKVSLELAPGAPPMRLAARVARVVGADCIGLQLEGLGMVESERLQEF